MTRALPPIAPRDWMLLLLYCAVLFGVALVSDRPLTMHEAVLPQSAREMYATGAWLVPSKGGEPWLESPPLPQWCTVAMAHVFGRCDTIAVVRLGPALVATAVVVLCVWTARWLGFSHIALLSGYVLATSFQFTRYAWLAEDEIYLCGVIAAVWACFVYLEFGMASAGDGPSTAAPQTSTTTTTTATPSTSWLVWLCGPRPWPMVLFWVCLGATNLVKGLFFGTAVAAAPIAVWLLLPWHWSRLAKYVWLPGLGLWLALLLAWPLAVLVAYPSVTEVWWYDLGGRMSGAYREINQPRWYYLANVWWMIAPWTFVAPLGLVMTWTRARSVPLSAERWLWIWTLAVPALLTIPSGKHHHYLLHGLAPWAMLAALGLEPLRQWVRGWPAWTRHPLYGAALILVPALVAVPWIALRQPEWLSTALGATVGLTACSAGLTWALWQEQRRLAAGALFGSLAVAYIAGHFVAGWYFDTHRHDVALLRQARLEADQSGEPIVIDLDRQPLTGFLDLFYQEARAIPVHNCTFLADPAFAQQTTLVVTRAVEQERLKSFGDVELVVASQRGQHDHRGDARLCLFRLTPLALSATTEGGVQQAAYTPSPAHSATHPRPTLRPHPVVVTPMQAMHRASGPFWTDHLASASTGSPPQ